MSRTDGILLILMLLFGVASAATVIVTTVFPETASSPMSSIEVRKSAELPESVATTYIVGKDGCVTQPYKGKITVDVEIPLNCHCDAERNCNCCPCLCTHSPHGCLLSWTDRPCVSVNTYPARSKWGRSGPAM